MPLGENCANWPDIFILLKFLAPMLRSEIFFEICITAGNFFESSVSLAAPTWLLNKGVNCNMSDAISFSKLKAGKLAEENTYKICRSRSDFFFVRMSNGGALISAE